MRCRPRPPSATLACAACLLALVSAAPDVRSPAPPRISLDLSAYSDAVGWCHGPRCGVACNGYEGRPAHADHELCHDKVRQDHAQAFKVCEAGVDTVQSCPLPQATALDHHEGDLSEDITIKVYLINDDGAAPTNPGHVYTEGSIDYAKRSE